MANEQNLIPFTGADDPRRGTKPKGTKHLATYIQEMLTDETFEATMLDSKKGAIEYKGAPIKAIIAVAIQKALHDKEKGQQWAEWLAKHGYGTTIKIESDDPIEELLVAYGIRKAIEDDRKDVGSVQGSRQSTT